MAIPDRAADPQLKTPPAISIEAICAVQVTSIEADLATLLQRRLDAAGPQLALIDYQIDLRLLERWMLSRAAEPKTPGELQAVITLRMASLQSAGEQIAKQLQNSKQALLPSQLDGLSRLHQLTYKLPAIKNVGTVDEMCKSIVPALILAANPAPAEVKNLPPMRPPPLPRPAEQIGPPPRTLAQLATRVKDVQVSPALKRQLGLLVETAQVAAVDPKSQEESASLNDMLANVVDLSEGIEKNTGIDADARPKIEQQLTEGLALFTDPRTRSSGGQRIAALTQYRKTLERVQRLNIPAALQPKLAPAFVWVNNNPDSGQVVLDSIEKYLQLCQRDDGRKESAALPANHKRTVEFLHKQFMAQRSGFLEDAAGLNAAAPAFLGGDPAKLAAHMQTMQELEETIESVENLPQAVQTLLSYKPRPTGGLEKRVMTAVADIGNPAALGSHVISLQCLADVQRVARLAESLKPPAGIAPGTIKAYTRDRLISVEGRKNALLAELSSQLAAGKDLDSTDLSKLQILSELYASLQLANDVENGLAKAEMLTRWADWSISPPQLRAMVIPYREGTAAAFEGFAEDNATPLFRWDDLRKRFMPVLLLVKDAGSYADACADFPTGLPGEFAKLLTPMDNQPFDIERFASLSVTIWQASATTGDQKTTDAVFETMLTRLKRAYRLE